MAGAKLTIDANGLEDITKRLNMLINKGEDMSDLFAEIGELLLISHHERFMQGVSPDGIPWEPLSPIYAERKEKHKDDILRLNDILSGTLTYDASSDGLLFGTPEVYGAIHQWGGTPDMRPQNADIPAREWLGLSENDSSAILDSSSDYLMSDDNRL